MAPVPLWVELLGSLFTTLLDGHSWQAGPQSNPLRAHSPAKSWQRVSALGFLTGQVNKGRVWEEPYRRVEELLFNSPQP